VVTISNGYCAMPIMIPGIVPGMHEVFSSSISRSMGIAFRAHASRAPFIASVNGGSFGHWPALRRPSGSHTPVMSGLTAA
jgi:hypothetical protein